ncbi:unnamed protein product, partial [Timema podura]|nr:unnamed protein product [Timema podura]
IISHWLKLSLKRVASSTQRYQLTHEQSKPGNSHSTEMYQGNRTREGRIFSFNTDENEIR